MKVTSIICINDGLFYWHVYAAFGLNGLMRSEQHWTHSLMPIKMLYTHNVKFFTQRSERLSFDTYFASTPHVTITYTRGHFLYILHDIFCTVNGYHGIWLLAKYAKLTKYAGHNEKHQCQQRHTISRQRMYQIVYMEQIVTRKNSQDKTPSKLALGVHNINLRMFVTQQPLNRIQ